MKVSILTAFKDAKKEAPQLSNNELTIPVYFICNGVMFKGEYHLNKNYYAYLSGGTFDCFASASGEYKGMSSGKNEICTHWCYISDLKIITH